MTSIAPFDVRFARDADDLRAAQRLRYEVFVAELGGDGPMVDHDARLERDEHDPEFDHLLLFDLSRAPGDQVVGAYRLLTGARAKRIGGFYSAREYDLDPLIASGRKLLELGRSCLHRDYRGGIGMFHMWSALADYALAEGVDLLFGTASFHGTDIERLAAPLSLLHHRHLAPEGLRPRAHADHFQRMDLIAVDVLDRRAAVLEIPALIKGYLRLGGCVGEGAFIDHEFNTTDVCLVLDTARLNTSQSALYTRGKVIAGG